MPYTTKKNNKWLKNLEFLVILAIVAIGQSFQHGSWVLNTQSYIIPKED